MTIRVNLQIQSIITEQSLIEDEVTYEIYGTVLGVPLRIPVPVEVIERLDRFLQGAHDEPPPRSTRNTQASAPAGYDIGIVDEVDDPAFRQFLAEDEDV